MDEIESGGLGRGNYAERFGGFVRPGGLAIDKLQLLHLVHLWSCAAFASGDGEDRLVFEQLRRESHGCTGAASVCVRSIRMTSCMGGGWNSCARGVVYDGVGKAESSS